MISYCRLQWVLKVSLLHVVSNFIFGTALAQNQLIYTDDFNGTIDTGYSDGTGLNTLIGPFNVEFGPGNYTPNGIRPMEIRSSGWKATRERSTDQRWMGAG